MALFASLSPLLGPLFGASSFSAWEHEGILWSCCRRIKPDTPPKHFHPLLLLGAQCLINWGGLLPLDSIWAVRINTFHLDPSDLCGVSSIPPTPDPRMQPREGKAQSTCSGAQLFILPFSPLLPGNPGDLGKLVWRVGKTGSESLCILWNLLSYALCSFWSLLWVRLLELQRLLSLSLCHSCPEAKCIELEWEEGPWENPGAGWGPSG